MVHVYVYAIFAETAGLIHDDGGSEIDYPER
jgi:hypothetical protein